jgi:C1A family cysteine protease
VGTPYRAVAWGYVAPDQRRPTTAQIKQALLDYGPLYVALYDTQQFQIYRGGVFAEHSEPEKGKAQPTHAVLLVGWDDTRGRHGCWKIKNSWRPDWGEQGFAWIEYDCNHIGMAASWVLAASRYYTPGPTFYDIVKEAKKLPAVRTAATGAASKANPSSGPGRDK